MKNEKSHQDKIKDLVNKLETLTIETRQLTQELKRLQENTTNLSINTNTQEAADSNPYKIGDRVIITNSYRGKKGTRGSIIATTTSLVTLIDHNGKEYKRKHTNVKHEYE